ncbi:divergent polysaccharide deacetylase family protein [Deferribacter desulfuricans]|uniref:divergent polysaccharide deacetylase family protein n=1 Tax=Deferribacter desulfuricans TaxID=197162 RepID=UPI00030A027A|nr:divergent polysaccharide deacetylase family protein [Deferribacter desulfuricans]
MAKKRKRTSKKKSKKFAIPPAFIVGGIFFVLILLIILITVNIKVSKVKQDISRVEKNLTNVENIKKNLKAFFFDLEIDKSLIQQSVVKNGSSIVLIYKINSNNSDTLLYNLTNFLKHNNFQSISIKNDIISAKKGDILIQFKINKNPYTHTNDYSKNTNQNLKHNSKKMLAIIIDDCGNNLKLAKKLANIPYPITFSIIPHLKYSKETAEIARKFNKPVFLHLPMQPKSYPSTDPGMGAIYLNTPKSLIKIIIKKNVESIGKIDGANNHMGSALTESREKMFEVLNELKNYTDIFVDSHTSSKTVAYNVCKKLNMRCGLNNKFIDNIDDKNSIKEILYKSLSLFQKQDKVIIIGHLKENTIEVLSEELPKISKKNIKITNILEVVN